MKSGSFRPKDSSKIPPPSLAMRNLQLAMVSIPFSLVGVLGPQYDRQRVLSNGILDGFDWLAWVVVLNQALGGLLIAAVVKHADSVAKGFATSLAVIRECIYICIGTVTDGSLNLVSTAISSIMSRILPNSQFVLCACFVISATTMFAVVR